MSDDWDQEGSSGSGLWLKLHATLDGLNSHMRKIETAWIQRASDTPRDVVVRLAGVIPAAGTTPTTLQGAEIGGVGPQPGEVWILRACRIGGVTPTTTAVGRGDLFMSPVDPSAGGATPSTAQWLDQATTLPLVAFYSSRQVVLRAPDNFYVVITNGTAGQQYVANAQFEVYRDGGYRPEITL